MAARACTALAGTMRSGRLGTAARSAFIEAALSVFALREP
jgi:hypothetical protein